MLSDPLGVIAFVSEFLIESTETGMLRSVIAFVCEHVGILKNDKT